VDRALVSAPSAHGDHRLHELHLCGLSACLKNDPLICGREVDRSDAELAAEEILLPEPIGEETDSRARRNYYTSTTTLGSWGWISDKVSNDTGGVGQAV
jgi:hypothetical protein